jgi:hypothetical protein
MGFFCALRHNRVTDSVAVDLHGRWDLVMNGNANAQPDGL